MKKLLAYTAAVPLVACLALAGAKTYDRFAFLDVDLENGKQQYVANCMSCHGAQGHGDGELSAELTVSADNIAEELKNPLGFKLELIQSVYTGDNGQQGEMPAFASVMSEKDISDALEYVRSIN